MVDTQLERQVLSFVSYLVARRVEGLIAAIYIIIVVVVVPRTPLLGEDENGEEQQQLPIHGHGRDNNPFPRSQSTFSFSREQ